MSSTPPNTLELGGTVYRIERPTGLKASRALALMRALSRAMPDLTTELAEFRRTYERENVLELDRVQARRRYPATPLVREGEPIHGPDGELVMVPSVVDGMSEADWQASGNVLRVPATPSTYEIVGALFDKALETAEHHIYRLVALFTIPNDELKALRRAGDGELDRALTERAEELLDDAYADELLELAVVVGETVDHHFSRKTTDLGERMGNALRLIGLNWRQTPTPAPTDGPSSSRPSSSTDTSASTPDGDPTTSSTPPTTSSSSSADTSSSTTDSPSSSGSASREEVPAPA